MRLQYVIFMLVLALINTISLPAQEIKRNADGQKLIKRISSDLLQIDGSVDPGSFNDTYEMTYFPDGRLKSITFSCRDENDRGRAAERISIEADTFNLAYFNNGKRNPNVSSVFNYYKGKRRGQEYRIIYSITRKTKECDSGGSLNLFSNIFFHNRYRTVKVELISSNEKLEDRLALISSNGPDCAYNHNYEKFSGGLYPNTNFMKAGFKREICYIEDEDGYLYERYKTSEKLRQEQDGNLLSNPAVPNSDSLGDIFTDLTNDTNLNLQFFFEIGMPELMTEWIPVRSRNLIKYEHAERYNRETRYKKYWEYEYDSAGNLIGATVIRTDVIPKAKYRLKIEYVTE